METLLSLARAAGHSDMPIPKRRGSAPYEGSAQGRRAYGWQATKAGPNQVLFGNAEILRDRSRDAVRKNPHAGNALSTWVSEAIGNGIKPRSQHPDPEIRKAIHEAWARWVQDSDTRGYLDFYGIQALAFRSLVESGEVFCRFWLRSGAKAKGLYIPLQLQLIEPDQLPMYQTYFPGVSTNNIVRESIEFDGDFDVVAYHMFRNHPYDTMFYRYDNLETIRVGAEDVVHMFQPLRAGQFRGQPWLAQVLVRLYELDQYNDAELVRKKVVAMFTAFIEKADADSTPLNEDTPDGKGNAESTLEPGTTQYLLPGETAKFSTPPVDAGFEPFTRAQLRGIAAGCGLTYELLTGDLTQVNYSSIRAGLLKFRRACEQIQYQVFVHQFCRKIWRRFLQEAVLAGRLDLEGYEDDPYPFERVKWVTPGWEWVDPVKDVTASIQAVRAGFTTRTTVVAAGGDDIEDIDNEWAAETERAEKMGLVFDSNPRQTLLRGAKDPTEPPPPEEEKPDPEEEQAAQDDGDNE